MKEKSKKTLFYNSKHFCCPQYCRGDLYDFITKNHVFKGKNLQQVFDDNGLALTKDLCNGVSNFLGGATTS